MSLASACEAPSCRRMAAATSARSPCVAATRPSMPPVLVRAPRQPRRTPRAPSGRQRCTTG
eukprot:7396108-Alexandrium_andersonii.AAC.1